MSDHAVSRRGTDSSGRGIYASDYMWTWWLTVLDSLPFGDKVVITQGAWMALNGGGASASAGYHDGGGCFDLRVWNLTQTETFALIRAIRRHGAAAWLRDQRHGGFTDPHIHLVLGTDHDLDDGAAYQWRDYIAGGDGMGGSDYHPRPVPLVTTPPQPKEWIDMATEDEVRRIVREEFAAVLGTKQANGKTLEQNIRIGANARDLAREILAALGKDK